MKLHIAWLTVFLLTAVSAWTAQDREIFHLKDAVEKDIGPEVTFYDWLKVDKSATDSQIAKAYRKMSQKLHPDKNPGKKAGERFSRLGLVVKVLRSEGRDRYDFFLKNGFPRWKGTDYYYSRYRPGLGFVLLFLSGLISLAQFAGMKLTASQHRNHMQSIIDEAKSMAWNGGLPTTQRKVTLANGKNFIVYPGGKVCLLDSDQEWPLDLSEIHDPTWKDTVLYTVPVKIYNKLTGNTPPEPQASSNDNNDDDNSNTEKSKKKFKPKPASKVGAARRRK